MPADTHSDRTPRVVNCHFTYRCPQSWNALTPTADERVRHCNACSRDVYRCDTEQEFEAHARADHCVAAIVDETGAPEMATVGVIAPPDAEGGDGEDLELGIPRQDEPASTPPPDSADRDRD